MAAAPYCHKRADEKMTKKEILEMAAMAANKDGDWGGSLDLPQTIKTQPEKKAA